MSDLADAVEDAMKTDFIRGMESAAAICTEVASRWRRAGQLDFVAAGEVLASVILAEIVRNEPKELS